MGHRAAIPLLSPLLSLILAMAVTPPIAAEELSTSSGAQLFQRYCASCHGRGGEGDGPVAPFFKLLPPDLTLLSRRNGGAFPAERVRSIVDGRTRTDPHGVRQMPVWGVEFGQVAPSSGAGQVPDDTITRLIEYLRSLQKPQSRPGAQ